MQRTGLLLRPHQIVKCAGSRRLTASLSHAVGSAFVARDNSTSTNRSCASLRGGEFCQRRNSDQLSHRGDGAIAGAGKGLILAGPVRVRRIGRAAGLSRGLSRASRPLPAPRSPPRSVHEARHGAGHPRREARDRVASVPRLTVPRRLQAAGQAPLP